jgi:integrase/recombinase XerD
MRKARYLYIHRSIKGRKAKFSAPGIKVRRDQWNEQKLRVKRSYPNSAIVNAKIAQKVADAEAIALTMETKHDFVTSKKIPRATKSRGLLYLANTPTAQILFCLFP